MVFKMALPFLPYRNPKIIPSVAGIPEVCRKKKITKVMIVTDEGIRRLGLTSFLEKTLTENNISYCIYDRTVANPTIWNVEEARELYLTEGARTLLWRRILHGLCQGCRCQDRKASPEHSADERSAQST